MSFFEKHDIIVYPEDGSMWIFRSNRAPEKLTFKSFKDCNFEENEMFSSIMSKINIFEIGTIVFCFEECKFKLELLKTLAINAGFAECKFSDPKNSVNKTNEDKDFEVGARDREDVVPLLAENQRDYRLFHTYMPEIILITLQLIIFILMGMYRKQNYLWFAIGCSLCNVCLYFGVKLNQAIYYIVMIIPMTFSLYLVIKPRAFGGPPDPLNVAIDKCLWWIHVAFACFIFVNALFKAVMIHK